MLDHVQQLPYLNDELMQRFDVDFRMVQLPAATTPGVDIFEEGDYLRLHRPLGLEAAHAEGQGFLF